MKPWAATIFIITAIAGVALVSSSGSGGGCPDPDNDGFCNMYGEDNCDLVANPSQRDDDEDGYGNLCDWDVTQDCAIGGPDLATTFARLFDANPWSPKNRGAYDVTEDNLVGGPDLAAIFENLFGNPGPTTRPCANCLAAPGGGVCP